MYNISQSPALKCLEITNPPDRIHNPRAYFSIPSPGERMSQRLDFLAIWLRPHHDNCQRHAKAITLHLIATLYSSLQKSISGLTGINTTPLQKIHCLATTRLHTSHKSNQKISRHSVCLQNTHNVASNNESPKHPTD